MCIPVCHHITWTLVILYKYMYSFYLKWSIRGLSVFLLYRYYWVRVTPRHAPSRWVWWHRQCLESSPRKQPGPATRSGSLSRTGFLTIILIVLHQTLVCSPGLTCALGPGQPGAANSCLVQPGPKLRALFLKPCVFVIPEEYCFWVWSRMHRHNHFPLIYSGICLHAREHTQKLHPRQTPSMTITWSNYFLGRYKVKKWGRPVHGLQFVCFMIIGYTLPIDSTIEEGHFLHFLAMVCHMQTFCKSISSVCQYCIHV